MSHPKWKYKKKYQRQCTSCQSGRECYQHGDRTYGNSNHGHSSRGNYSYSRNLTREPYDKISDRNFEKRHSSGNMPEQTRTSDVRGQAWRKRTGGRTFKKRPGESSTSLGHQTNWQSRGETSSYHGNVQSGGRTLNDRSSQLECSISSTNSQSGNSTSRSTSSGESSSSSSHSKIKQLPGFYYDPEKKKYFRLLPGHNNHNPLTKDGIKLEAAEKSRVQMMQGGNVSEKHASQKAPNSDMNHMLVLHRNRENGQLTNQQFARYAHEQCVKLLPVQPTCTDTLFQGEFGEPGSMTFLKLNQDQSRFLVAVYEEGINRFYHGAVTAVTGSKDKKDVGIVSLDSLFKIHNGYSKVTNVEWGTSSIDGELQVVCTMPGYADHMSSIAFVCKGNQDTLSQPGHKWIVSEAFSTYFTCALNHNPLMPPQISIGLSRYAEVVDVMTAQANNRAKRSRISIGNSDVLAQVFSQYQPILYNGTRRGEILGCDSRIPTVHNKGGGFACKLKHSMCVCSVKLLKDENYMLASDISGMIRLWDLRMCHYVLSYKGLVNKHSQLPICVDSSETVVYGAGSDKCTRFWSLQDGRLLHTIPSPLPVKTTGQPIPVYSRQWHGGATPGLILGMGRQLFWYSLAL